VPVAARSQERKQVANDIAEVRAVAIAAWARVRLLEREMAQGTTGGWGTPSYERGQS
jgi:hypothetical protein